MLITLWDTVEKCLMEMNPNYASQAPAAESFWSEDLSLQEKHLGLIAPGSSFHLANIPLTKKY